MNKQNQKKLQSEHLKCLSGLSGLSGQFQRSSSKSICSEKKNESIKKSTSKTSTKVSSASVATDDIPCICVCAERSSMESVEEPKKPDTNMLITGFGMRNHESLQRALLDDEQRRAMLLHQYRDSGEECTRIIKTSSSSSYRSSKLTSEESSQATMDLSTTKMLPLEYLMGLSMGQIEEAPEPSISLHIEEKGEVEEKPTTTLAMRKAQKYLRTHRIFEFFQFLTAHLLSALPDDPITFLLELLDKCLIYRTGLGFPPLLYDKPHLEQLFYLMDRMRTGFIELEQYKTGMATLGICSYDKNPPLTSCNMVAKDVFIEEAYECLTDLFQDMIRRRGTKSTTTPSLVTPPPTEVSLSVGSKHYAG